MGTAGLWEGTAAAPAVAVLVVLAAHAAVPWSMRVFPPRDPLRTYDRATIVLSAAALAAATAGGAAWKGPFAWPWTAAVIAASAAVGVLLPLAGALLSGKRLRRRPAPSGTAGHTRLAACALGEEALWRISGPAALHGVGVPIPLALALCLLAFLGLHVPKSGARALPYLGVMSLAMTACAAAGGLAAATCAHVSHNLTLEWFAPAQRGTRRPSSRPRGERPTGESAEDAPPVAPSRWD
ncbi:CPBP family glutamic-type intramembrane protease [Allosalinactinospora lopnorensis]|uniref:CPBP family glutamic-type intramembrane protease n=1 Tax=Allosalinactinospora lopnorensis TaxID=1352348 RepID=UPI000623C327|nr:CPBP family glutamic-type intramembrane protease [Allosalinactinospora lopnorensis]